MANGNEQEERESFLRMSLDVFDVDRLSLMNGALEKVFHAASKVGHRRTILRFGIDVPNRSSGRRQSGVSGQSQVLMHVVQLDYAAAM